MAQKHLSVFHAGVIGYGLRPQAEQGSLPEAEVRSNTRLLVAVVTACCQDNGQPSMDAITGLALLLVEMLSPDVMYNGLPWPEEDFCKVCRSYWFVVTCVLVCLATKIKHPIFNIY